MYCRFQVVLGGAGLIFAGAPAFGAAAADIVIRIAPPHVSSPATDVATEPLLGVDFRVPSLGWHRLRLEPRKVGTASTAACPPGIASLGSPPGQLGLGGGRTEHAKTAVCPWLFDDSARWPIPWAGNK
jgi:hypothetical protein